MEGRRQGGDGRTERSHPRRVSIVLTALLFALVPVRGIALGPSPFTFLLDARTVLHSLWKESVQAHKERVACIGGHFDGGVFHITRAEPVEVEFADSLRAAPGASLDRCGPPEWAGTAHTHIALYRGQPYSTFSMSDRAVMAVWRARWRAEGVFCVLYSATEAYCEYGMGLSGDVDYGGPQRGNVIFP